MGRKDTKRSNSKRKTETKDINYSLSSISENSRGDSIEEDSGLGDSIIFASSDDTSSNDTLALSEESRGIISQDSKRLRLDFTEDTNELPADQFYSNQIMSKVVSFKNVGFMKPPPLSPTFSFQNVQVNPPSLTIKQEKTKKSVTSKHVLDKSFPSVSLDGKVSLVLLSQPEEQHRARYQTEGSRGAVKDRSGQGHPIIKLMGYEKPALLEVYVSSDNNSVAPHLCYQAYKVTGKTSTPCSQMNVDRTTVLQIEFLPEKDMTVNCDCVGLLKERNVDVEQRLKGQYKGRRKSTKCRLVFRTTIINSGLNETLQVVSEPICCTQPPGIPEISRKSLSSCSIRGGEEMFIIGKNFLKDTKVIFQDENKGAAQWKVTVSPEKELLHQTHLICVVPPYTNQIYDSVEVQVFVTSCQKISEPHSFKYFIDTKRAFVGHVENDVKYIDTAGGFKEQAVVHPLNVQRPIAVPLVQPNRQEINNTKTTATVSAPRTTTIQPVSIKSENESKAVAIDNLAGALRLTRDTPLGTRPEFVLMIADAIISELRKNPADSREVNEHKVNDKSVEVSRKITQKVPNTIPFNTLSKDVSISVMSANKSQNQNASQTHAYLVPNKAIEQTIPVKKTDIQTVDTTALYDSQCLQNIQTQIDDKLNVKPVAVLQALRSQQSQFNDNLADKSVYDVNKSQFFGNNNIVVSVSDKVNYDISKTEILSSTEEPLSNKNAYILNKNEYLSQNMEKISLPVAKPLIESHHGYQISNNPNEQQIQISSFQSRDKINPTFPSNIENYSPKIQKEQQCSQPLSNIMTNLSSESLQYPLLPQSIPISTPYSTSLTLPTSTIYPVQPQPVAIVSSAPTTLNTTIASQGLNSLSQLSESELINYINPNCFEKFEQIGSG